MSFVIASLFFLMLASKLGYKYIDIQCFAVWINISVRLFFITIQSRETTNQREEVYNEIRNCLLYNYIVVSIFR